MRRWKAVTVVALTVPMACAPDPPTLPPPDPVPQSRPSSEPQVRLIVTLATGVDADDAAEQLGEEFADRLTVRRALNEVGQLVVSIDPELRDELARHPVVAAVQDDVPDRPSG